MKGLDRLLELQELDLAIDRLEHRRERLESGLDVAEARAAMEEAESRLGELRLALDAAAAEQRRLESEVDSMERKGAAEERRLYDGSIANVKELEALQHEIASLQERKARVEDDLLEVMERREELVDPEHPEHRFIRGARTAWFACPQCGARRRAPSLGETGRVPPGRPGRSSPGRGRPPAARDRPWGGPGPPRGRAARAGARSGAARGAPP